MSTDNRCIYCLEKVRTNAKRPYGPRHQCYYITLCIAEDPGCTALSLLPFETFNTIKQLKKMSAKTREALKKQYVLYKPVSYLFDVPLP